MIPFRELLKRCGGKAQLVRDLGFPVNAFILSVWARNGYVPEDFRKRVAFLADCLPEDLIPDAPPDRLTHRGTARMYGSAFHALGLSKRYAARLHKCTVEQVDRWLAGFDEAPLSVFADLHYFATGKQRQVDRMTVEAAIAKTGLRPASIAVKIGCHRSLMTRWRRRGWMPDHAAQAVMDLVGEGRADAA